MTDRYRPLSQRPPEMRAPGIWIAYASVTGAYPTFSGTALAALWRRFAARTKRRQGSEDE